MRRFLVAVVLAVAVTSTLSVSGRAAAAGPNRAGIVVSFGDGRVESVCVDFAEPEISGAELLRRAGFSAVASSAWGGGATCMIDNVGCADPNDCWCQCHGAGCRYWAYHTLEDGAWRYSPIGASQRKVHNGDVDGWAWGVGSAGAGAKLDPTTFDEICPPPASAASAPAPAPTLPPTITREAASEVAGATAAAPLTTVTVGHTPTPSSIALSTGRPTQSPTPVAPTTKEEDVSGFPWQLPAFAVMAVGLLGTAFALSKRRSRG
jgi:hypothetical protein